MPATPPKLLVLAVDNQSSTIARIDKLIAHPQFAFQTRAVLRWPYQATASVQAELWAKIESLQAEIDLILLHRVLLPPELQKWLFALGKPVVYDFDDAIYAVPSATYQQEATHPLGWLKRLGRWLRRGRPFYAARYAPLVSHLRQVQAVSAGNPHLAAFAQAFCRQVAVVPTAVDVRHFPLKQHHTTFPVTIGWYGSPDNQWYLDTLLPALHQISQTFGDQVQLQVISSKRYTAKGLTVGWHPWHREQELQDLLHFDIGLMPLTNDEWARGKSGNKALYYMGLGIPAVVSPVGVNRQVVRHGETGFHAQTTAQWVEALSHLLTDSDLRQRLGMNGRQWVSQAYATETAVEALNNILQTTFTTHFGATHE